MICLHDRNYPHRKSTLIDTAVAIKKGWVIGGAEPCFAGGTAVQLEFTSAQLRCRDVHMKSAGGGVSTAEGADAIKAEEKCTSKERAVHPTSTLHSEQQVEEDLL